MGVKTKRIHGGARVTPTGLDQAIELQDTLVRQRQFLSLGAVKVIKFAKECIPTENFNQDNFYVRTMGEHQRFFDIDFYGARHGIAVGLDARQTQLLVIGPVVFPPIPDPEFVAPAPMFEKKMAPIRDKDGNPTGEESEYDTGRILNEEERKTPMITQPIEDLVWGTVHSHSSKEILLCFQPVTQVLIEVRTGPEDQQGYHIGHFHADETGAHCAFLYNGIRGYFIGGRLEITSAKSATREMREQRDHAMSGYAGLLDRPVQGNGGEGIIL